MKKKILSVLLAVFLMVGMLTVMASADAPKQAWVRIPGVNAKGEPSDLMITITEGNGPDYYVTDENGKASSIGADADNYNVKLEYPAGGTPSMSLKNATLINSQWSCISIGRVNYGGQSDITDFPFIIKVEADSTLTAQTKDVEAGICGYVCIGGSNRDTLTITGPGKLTCIAESSHTISQNGGDLIFKDIDLVAKSEIPNSWGGRLAVLVSGGNIVLDNTKMELSTTAGACMWISDKYTNLEGDPYNITVKNGSSLKATNQFSNHSTIGCLGEITFDNSSVELISKAKCFSPKPVLTGVGAVGGTKVANAKPYNEKKAASYTYFKCGTDIVAETEPVTEATEATTPVTEATTPATEATIPATQATTPATQATTPATQATTPATQATTPNVDDGQTENGGNVLLYVILGVLVAAAVAAAVIFVVMKKKNDEDDSEDEEVVEDEEVAEDEADAE